MELSDIVEIHTLELPKLPPKADGTDLYDWAKFIAAETEEELTMIAERNPQVGKAVVTLRELSADERVRDMYERREKARRDMASREKWAKKKTQIHIAKNMISDDEPLEKIIKYTGLSHEELDELCDTV